MKFPKDLSRRLALQAGGALALASVGGPARARDFGTGAEPTRYPDSDLIEHDPRFHRIMLANTPCS